MKKLKYLLGCCPSSFTLPFKRQVNPQKVGEALKLGFWLRCQIYLQGQRPCPW